MSGIICCRLDKDHRGLHENGNHQSWPRPAPAVPSGAETKENSCTSGCDDVKVDTECSVHGSESRATAPAVPPAVDPRIEQAREAMQQLLRHLNLGSSKERMIATAVLALCDVVADMNGGTNE